MSTNHLNEIPDKKLKFDRVVEEEREAKGIYKGKRLHQVSVCIIPFFGAASTAL